jgi:hypothetical protein
MLGDGSRAWSAFIMGARPWVGSVAVHAAIGVAWWVSRPGEPAPAPPPPPVEVSLVDVAAPVEEPETATVLIESGGVPLPRDVEQPPARRTARPAPRAHANVVRAAPMPAAPDERISPPVPNRPALATSPIPAHNATDAPGAATPAAPVVPEGARGTATPPAPPPIVTPPSPDATLAHDDHEATAPVLKPRSPILISRAARPRGPRGESRDDGQFVAILTIDTDGSVIGARLKRGPPGRRSERAMAAVWRLRYHPAVDGDGHPIKSRVEQRFVIE